ncbi:MAG: AbrB/MazE/SpoVT family DNA-binding domain-containing protein [Cellvibrionaceae bacterium]|nr:AbrB/MazE/SpoVT family DNA-binding domain-containing protein [Cellvibrionaceae bacterium]
MAAATVTSKGQITVPASVRASLHLQAGDRIEFIQIDDGKFEIVAASNDVTQLKGLIKVNKKVSLEEMNVAIKTKASQ